jgi:hypothetical protein
MGEITQAIPRDPDADATLKDILEDVVARNRFDRKLVRFTVTAQQVTLVFQTPD